MTQLKLNTSSYTDDYTWTLSSSISMEKNKRYILQITTTGGSANKIFGIDIYGYWQ